MTGLHIRPATVEDAHGIATVHVQSWQHAYQGEIPAQHLRSLSIDARAQRWQNILGNPAPHTQMLVAEDEATSGAIIGFCSVGPSRDEDATPSIGEIYAIYVAPEQMGQGVGSALLAAGGAALAQEGCTRVTLWVLATNTSAQQFYRRHGFVPDGARKMDSIGGVTLEEVRYVHGG